VTEPDRPAGVRDVDYKGAPLDSEKGPGLGCFWTQLVVLGVLLVLTPLSVAWNWPFWVSGTLLIVVLLLLLLAGQTVIFLLRLVAADRRAAGRRRPLASGTPTVGELEDRGEGPADEALGAPEPVPPSEPVDDPTPDEAAPGTSDERSPGPPDGGVRE
jgi:hypothetical protein